MSHATKPEPWLRGPLDGVHPVVAPIFYAFEQALEDLEKWTAPLSDTQIWARIGNIAPVGFQLRHIAGSVERLMTYVTGDQLNDSQLAALKTEQEPGAGRAELIEYVRKAFRDAEAVVRRIDPNRLSDPREVGRKKLPSSVVGLLTHIAEHTQRHVGETIITSKVIQATP